jgi:hypothetical protein
MLALGILARAGQEWSFPLGDSHTCHILKWDSTLPSEMGAVGTHFTNEASRGDDKSQHVRVSK